LASSHAIRGCHLGHRHRTGGGEELEEAAYALAGMAFAHQEFAKVEDGVRFLG
jgi:hypothetical protein